MDLMIDPACELNTFADVLKVGRACDEANFFWYEDPGKDLGISAFAYHKLRQLIRTPLCLGEHVRSLEPHVDFSVAERSLSIDLRQFARQFTDSPPLTQVVSAG
jgi:L-alanine-DL-glutamate epimerase-like enolase superfamily enzyme